MRIGVFGGTFDPPHFGHLRLARAAYEQLGLDKVLWVLTANPPHKRGQRLSPIEDRLAMVQAALKGQAAFELSRVDIDRPGPHWAADTVRLLAQQHPGAQLIYLMGSDSLNDLPTWGRPMDFLAHCSLGVLRRPGDAVDLAALEAVLPGITAKVAFVDAPSVNIASHAIRRRVRSGEALTRLVPKAVEHVIRERGLYRSHYAQANRQNAAR